jgi:excisionase family DNA binding protein
MVVATETPEKKKRTRTRAAGQEVQIESDLLKVKEAADHLRLGKSTVYALMESGRLPFFKLGGSIRLSRADLDAYRESCRVGGV